MRGDVGCASKWVFDDVQAMVDVAAVYLCALHVQAAGWMTTNARAVLGHARRCGWPYHLTSPHSLFLLLLQLTCSLISHKRCISHWYACRQKLPGCRIVSHYFVVIVGMLPADTQSLLLLPSLCVFWLGLMPCSVVSPSFSLSGGSAFSIAGAEDSGAIGPEMVVARRNALSGLDVMPSSDGSRR
jgi:hypothetical protein